MRLTPGFRTRLCRMRWQPLSLPVLLLLSACATSPPFDGRIEILSTARDQPLEGADCVVTTDAGSWSVRTPGYAQVGAPNGDLRVLCNRAGYRTSEVILRNDAAPRRSGATRVGVGIGGGSGGYSGVGLSLGFGFPVAGARGDYPSRVTVDMTPLQ